MPHSLPTSRSRFRLLTERIIYLLMIAMVLQVWCLEGLLIPYVVSGGSMAPGLVGVHRDVICRDCGHHFVCGSDLRPVGDRAVCPNCGYVDNKLSEFPELRGDGLLISKSVFRVRRPRRWEIVAFCRPQQAGQFCVKRVVGLPGETIEIRHGDVYADGEIQRKTLPQQRAMGVLVHDANCRPIIDPVPPPRWQGEGKGGQWLSDGGRFGHPLTSEDESIDWLVYRHWRRLPGQKGEIREGPITDLSGYNQTRPRRDEDTHRVTDLMLSLRLIEVFGPGRLVISASDGPEGSNDRHEFQVVIYPSRNRYEVLQNDRPVPAATGKLPVWTDALTVEVSLFDQQFLLALDGRLAFPPRPYVRNGQPQDGHFSPLKIGSQGLRVVLNDLRVCRDVYCTHPIGPDGGRNPGKTYHLHDDEYFVLGDNSPISEDSRTWSEYALDAKLLIGKPLLVHFPARHIRLGGRDFQVPDPAKIRYIR